MQTTLNSDTKGFEKKSSSIITPDIKTGIVIVSIIAVATAIWSVTAKIPIIVNTSGIMIPARGLFKAAAPSSGILVYPFVKNNGKISFEPPSWSALAYDYQWGNAESGAKDTDKAIRLAEAIAAEIAEDRWVRFSSVDVDESPDKIQVPFKSVIAIIDNAETRANLLLTLQEYKDDLKVNSARKDKLAKDLSGAKVLVQKNKEILESSRPISPQAISRTSLLQFEQQWLSEVSRSRSIEQDIIQNQNELIESRKKLVRALQSYLTTSMVYAFEDAAINSFLEEQWASVNPGSELLTLSWSDEVSPNTIPLFLDSSTFTQVSTGMEVVLTPEGFNPAEVGGIKGTVQSISPLPKDMASLDNTLGVSAAAQSAKETIGGNVYLAEVKLSVQKEYQASKNSLFLKNAIEAKGDNKGGFVWNNNSNPPLPPRTGLKLNAQVTTRYMTPAAMVLSFLREFSGIETPSNLRKSS
jgi:hypothetical protein